MRRENTQLADAAPDAAPVTTSDTTPGTGPDAAPAPPSEAHRVLSSYTGYPDIPNGRPCGMWAYTMANASRKRTFTQHPDGHVVRHTPGTRPVAGARTYSVDVPYWDPEARRRPALYYAAIETDPTGIMVPSLPKGTQDLLAHRHGECLRIELGQKRQLMEVVRDFAARPELPTLRHGIDPALRRMAEINALHEQVVTLLLERGYSVEVESVFRTAVRETREEHGFDFLKEGAKVRNCLAFVGMALSKRSPAVPIEHFIYAVQVDDFDDTLPRVSRIVEEKDPTRDGCVYEERGVFLTLDEMDRRLSDAAARVAAEPASRTTTTAAARATELRVARSRLAMLRRIEEKLLGFLPAFS
ncbi:hypothetical protein [Streptomyces sp. NPDC058579]|uniref:hypothetical protein n=1 Tax=Streptomyces sp. NPDC058579 TaxID=3346548 RepID=UPI0036600B8C